jgi:hypothetical protein
MMHRIVIAKWMCGSVDQGGLSPCAMAYQKVMDSRLDPLVLQTFRTGLVAPSHTNTKCTGYQGRANESCSHVLFPGLLVKLRSFRCAMPVEAATDSILNHMVSHHFATCIVAPCPTNIKRASNERGSMKIV